MLLGAKAAMPLGLPSALLTSPVPTTDSHVQCLPRLRDPAAGEQRIRAKSTLVETSPYSLLRTQDLSDIILAHHHVHVPTPQRHMYMYKHTYTYTCTSSHVHVHTYCAL